MPNREEMIALLRQQYPYLAAHYGVTKIGLFGSYARDQADDTSDVGIIVEFERPLGFRFVELAEYLERLLGRRVDVLTPTGVRGIRLPWVAEEIERSVIDC
ncbi:nucleotidyltransferase [Chloroflexus islandicus]|uniref:Nucleotidyltransferase n=1 Tax=Chloroflexus islandicus TaxID=1707952 RepID=A0A178MEI7_9CHLR|nr:nucleotidyltransferase family protein [Chloroflexus islandicus]OAN46254.1 nucleotidyltransferase [Chloroflexus islandicus]